MYGEIRGNKYGEIEGKIKKYGEIGKKLRNPQQQEQEKKETFKTAQNQVFFKSWHFCHHVGTLRVECLVHNLSI